MMCTLLFLCASAGACDRGREAWHVYAVSCQEQDVKVFRADRPYFIKKLYRYQRNLSGTEKFASNNIFTAEYGLGHIVTSIAKWISSPVQSAALNRHRTWLYKRRISCLISPWLNASTHK